MKNDNCPVNGDVFLNSKKMHLVNIEFYMLLINSWSEQPSAQCDGICFSSVVLRVWTPTTTNDLLRAIFTSVRSKNFLAHLKLFKNILTTFCTTKTAWEMNSQFIRWPLLEQIIYRWWNIVSVQCSSRDCERFANLYNATVVLSTSMIFLHSACNSPW